MLTINPADAWNMPVCGTITNDYDADIVIAKRKSGMQKMDNFFALNPEDILMIIHKGNIRLFDEELYGQLSTMGFPIENFYNISINDKYKYIFGNLPQLIKSIKNYYPEAVFPVSF